MDSVLSQNVVFCVAGLIEDSTVQYIGMFLSQIAWYFQVSIKTSKLSCLNILAIFLSGF